MSVTIKIQDFDAAQGGFLCDQFGQGVDVSVKVMIRSDVVCIKDSCLFCDVFHSPERLNSFTNESLPFCSTWNITTGPAPHLRDSHEAIPGQDV
jgi:hypothetical protein